MLTELQRDFDGFPINPRFGSRYFFRAWRMRKVSGHQLEATMEDTSHALSVMIGHRDGVVTSIEGTWERAPLSSCHGAGNVLIAMIGCPLSIDLHAIARYTPASLQCTHMLDTARVGIVHLAADRPDRRYDVVFPDTVDGDQPVSLLLDGVTVLDLVISADKILSPQPFEGVHLFQGLARWAAEHLDATQYERLFLVQRAAFVARGARIDASFFAGKPAIELGPPEGSCFGSQPERYHSATRNATWRPNLAREDALDFEFISR